jgi:hypothetical protein
LCGRPWRWKGANHHKAIEKELSDRLLAGRILPDGVKEILGIWVEQSEGAKFWLRVKELKNRSLSDILVAVVDVSRASRGDQRPLPADHCPDPHRAPGPPFAGVRVLEGQKGRHARR